MNENTKKTIAIISSIGILSFFFIIPLFIAVFSVLGLFDGDGSSSGGSSSGIVYESSCNYEDTMVTVMDVNNTTVLSTVKLEDYIIGVAVYEIGAYGGAYDDLDEDHIKAQYIAAKTWLLSTKNYNSTTKNVVVTASTNDQQWCDLEKGCYDVNYGNGLIGTFPGGYNGISAKRTLTEKDIETARRYYQETYGELYLPNNYNEAITTLSEDTATFFVSTTQDLWEKLANEGNDYLEILKLTGLTSGNPGAGYTSWGSDISTYYNNKSIYQLKNYCKSTNTGSSGLDEAEGDVFYNNGGLPIPMYYQGDYPDVILAYANPSKGLKERTVKTSGCGFTSSAMIVSYLLDKKITPREFVDDWSREYYVRGDGMSHGLPSAAAKHYGLGDVEITTDKNKMIKALKEGHPVMSSQGPGLFTSAGHLIVLRGITSDGKILVNDPNKSNAVNKGYNEREFTIDEIEAARGKYFIWPKKT